MKKLLLSFVLMALMVSVATADTVTLQWDGNTEPDLAGYYLYRAERIGDRTTAWERIKAVSKDVTTCTDEVEDGKNYAWLLTAFDTTDSESFVSNMVERYDRTPPFAVRNLRKE